MGCCILAHMQIKTHFGPIMSGRLSVLSRPQNRSFQSQNPFKPNLKVEGMFPKIQGSRRFDLISKHPPLPAFIGYRFHLSRFAGSTSASVFCSLKSTSLLFVGENACAARKVGVTQNVIFVGHIARKIHVIHQLRCASSHLF